MSDDPRLIAERVAELRDIAASLIEGNELWLNEMAVRLRRVADAIEAEHNDGDDRG